MGLAVEFSRNEAGERVYRNSPPVSIREVQESFLEPRPAYTTIQTTTYRLEAKKAVRRVRKIGNSNAFEAAVGRNADRRCLTPEEIWCNSDVQFNPRYDCTTNCSDSKMDSF